jgi:hypothetical protein
LPPQAVNAQTQTNTAIPHGTVTGGMDKRKRPAREPVKTPTLNGPITITPAQAGLSFFGVDFIKYRD